MTLTLLSLLLTPYSSNSDHHTIFLHAHISTATNKTRDPRAAGSDSERICVERPRSRQRSARKEKRDRERRPPMQ